MIRAVPSSSTVGLLAAAAAGILLLSNSGGSTPPSFWPVFVTAQSIPASTATSFDDGGGSGGGYFDVVHVVGEESMGRGGPDIGVRIEDFDEEVPPLFPLSGRDYLGFLVAFLGLALAAGGGIGGGGILVPVYILVLDFPVKLAVSLSSVTVLGGAIANNLLNNRKRHPLYPGTRSLIDWDLVLQLEPMTLAGTIVGADLNHFLPNVVIVVLLLGLLSITAYKTLTKANKLYAQETEQEDAAKSLRNVVDAEDDNRDDPVGLKYAGDAETEALVPSSTSDEDESVDTRKGAGLRHFSHYGSTESDAKQDVRKSSLMIRWESSASFVEEVKRHDVITDITKLVCLFGLITVLNLMKGGPEEDETGAFGMPGCGAACFWLAQLLTVLLIVLFAILARATLLARIECPGYPRASDIEWDRTNTITYPAMGIVAGVLAGMFGIGAYYTKDGRDANTCFAQYLAWHLSLGLLFFLPLLL